MIQEFSVTPPAPTPSKFYAAAAAAVTSRVLFVPAGVLSHFRAGRGDDARLMLHRTVWRATLAAHVVRTVASLVANRRAVIGRIVRHTRVEVDAVELHLAEVFLGARIADSVFQLLLCKVRR